MPSTRPRRKVVKSPTPDEDEDMLSESGSDNLEVEDEVPEDVDQEDEDLEADDDAGQDEENAESGDEDDELLSQEEDEEGDEEEEDDDDEDEEEDEEQDDDEEQEVVTPRKETKRTAANKRKRQGTRITYTMKFFVFDSNNYTQQLLHQGIENEAYTLSYVACLDEFLIFSDEEMSETEVVANRPLTKRQRAKLNDGAEEDYLELPMGTSMLLIRLLQARTKFRENIVRLRKEEAFDCRGASFATFRSC